MSLSRWTPFERLLFVGKELIDAVLWIGGVFVIGFFLLYGNVFTLITEELFGREEQKQTVVVPSVAETVREIEQATAAASAFVTQGNTDSLVIPEGSVASVTDHLHGPTLGRYLEDRLASYKTPFSLLPPGKYLRIHRLGVDAPIVDVSYASDTQMQQGAFHDELTKGVVKYPFTSEPGNVGNTLIFGHSSVDFWETKKNPYGFIFSHLNELQEGDTIEIAWNGQQYFYSVETTVIKKPTQVNEVLGQFAHDKYLTLMACYPRFSTAERILVVAKAIDADTFAKKQLAQHTTTQVN